MPTAICETLRGPVDTALEDIEVSRRIALRTDNYSVFRSFQKDIIRAAEKLVEMPAANHDDVARAADIIAELDRSAEYPRTIAGRY